MEKRTLWALVISFAVLGFYPVLMKHLYPDYYKAQEESHQVSKTAAATDAKQFVQTPAIAAGEALLPANDIPVTNDKLELAVNPKGGVICSVRFPAFVDSERNSPLSFLSSKEVDGTIGLLVLDPGPLATADYELHTAGNGTLTARGTLDGVRVAKVYSFNRSGYGGKLELVFQNNSDTAKEFRYRLYAGPSIAPRHSIDQQYIEANFFSVVSGKNELKHIKESKLGKSAASDGFVQWVATKDRHFSVILKPKESDSFTGLVEGAGNHHFKVSLVSPKISLAPQSSITHEFVLYIGPNELEELEPLGLDTIVNFGKLDGIGRLLVGALEMLHKVFRNYGVSIIVLTLLINLLLFPLTRQSFMSMKRMQLVQPQMNRLREQHKKNPERLNKETMELYKKHKVNPFGGCLPMIIQMPVFISLYVALSKSVILINSKLLWIKDLSSPDNLKFPMALPGLGSEIHVLPLVMCVAMFFQQKFTQIKMEGQDPAMESQQKMMAYMMPVIFGFIFYTMPSGLVLYWLTNTLMMTMYQLSLKKVTLT